MKKIFITIALAILGFLGFYYFHEEKYEPEVLSVQTIEQDALEKRLSMLSRDRLEKMRLAGEEVIKWQTLFNKFDTNVVTELINTEGRFYKSRHYPRDDAYDHENGCQYFYHAHRRGEHGHFHLFLRHEEEDFSHLVAISMNHAGAAQELFTVNQWVTGEALIAAEKIEEMIDQFNIEHLDPSWPINRWLTAMVHLFYPQIMDLLQERDQILEKENTDDLDVLSKKPIDVETQMGIIYSLLEKN